jgi:hypothetical protein
MSTEVRCVRRALEGQEISIHKYSIILINKKSVYIHHKKEWLPFHYLRNYNLYMLAIVTIYCYASANEPLYLCTHIEYCQFFHMI